MKSQDNAIIGIYKITNPKGKVYIGQSIDVERRKISYKTLRIRGQLKIHNSIQKYTWENHIHEVIEECSIDQLNERETYWKQYYLDQFGGDWGMVLFCNLHDNGGGPLSEETKQKISKANKGRKYTKESCEKISQKLKGRNFSKDTINKMSKPRNEDAKLNMRYKKSKEHSSNISKNNKGKPQPDGFVDKLKSSNRKHWERGSERNNKIGQSNSKSILQFDVYNNFIKEWDSIMEACFFLNNHKHDSGIGLVCNGKRKTAYGYKWKFKI